MYQPLNSAQQKLVEENHDLIFAFLEKHNLSLDDTEDWYGSAAIGLCNAAVLYTSNGGDKFPAIAYECMDNEVKRGRDQNNRGIPNIVSLDDKTIWSYFVSSGFAPADPEFRVFLHDAIDIALRELSDCDKAIIELMIGHGSTPEDAAQKLGFPAAHVLKVFESFISKVKSYLND